MELTYGIVKTDRKETALMLFSAAVYIGTAAFGVIKLFDSGFPSSQAALILLSGGIGFVLSFFPVAVRRLLKIRFAFPLQLALTVFIFLAIIFGEALNFYYKLPWWDSMLHLVSGFGVAFMAFCLINMLIKSSCIKNSFVFCLITAAAISLAVGLLWEIGEFSVDTLLGTNMQKFIPDIFFNGGQSKAALSGEQETIAKFFISPQGYRFALIDTMKDVILCLCGTTTFIITAVLTKKSSVYTAAIIKDAAVNIKHASNQLDGEKAVNKTE